MKPKPTAPKPKRALYFIPKLGLSRCSFASRSIGDLRRHSFELTNDNLATIGKIVEVVRPFAASQMQLAPA